jgi:Xaa-Pro aminopeptidase
MATGRTAYGGDEALARLLSSAGLDREVSEIRELIAGVLAAPQASDAEAWMVLLGRDPASLPAELRSQLQALKDSLAPVPVPSDTAARVARLRAELDRRGLAGFVVPRADEHQGEYVPPRAERLAWITGFTGSAGLALVLREKAAVFVDGRYTLQVRAEVPGDIYEFRHLVEDPLADWVAGNLPPGGRLGYDPWLHTIGGVDRLRAAAAQAGGELVACSDNPLDAVWTDRPPAPLAPVFAHDLRHAGHPAEDKIGELADALGRDGADAAVLTQPDSIAWLLNIRGGDVPRTPLPLSFALLHADGRVDLFIDRRKLSPGLDAHLGNHVSVQAPEALGEALDMLGREGKRVRVDPSSAAAAIFDRLSRAQARIDRGPDPCVLPKACKNETELAGMRAAHGRDGVAMARFLAWLGRTALERPVGELEAQEKLLEIRAGGELFRDLSFDTISGAGPNGAIVHYRSSPATERSIGPGILYLLDSGAQYLDGTTDITRTTVVGEPDPEMRDRFTRVLKGHIALAAARFPEGTTGSQLDALARQFLWQAGLDFDHGTGHGVGSYLSVHEGPQRISKIGNTVALKPGMILSNEPGYYKTGAYGIRIENLVAVQPCTDLPGAERPMLCFETLTLAPIDLALVEPGLLTAGEIAWLNAYHARVREELSARLDEETAAWLTAATAPILV